MMNLRIFLDRFIPQICGIITISFTPFATIDPTSPIKMALLGTCAFGLLFAIFLLKPSQLHSNSLGNYLLLGLTISLLVVFFKSEENKIEQFYGTISRNFGLLSQLSLIIFCAAGAAYSSSNLILKIKKSILLYGSINMAYGTLQVMGEDFVSSWDTTFVNTARGFFANPNQYSSFTAMVALVSMSNLLDKKRKLSENLGTLSFASFAILNIYFANSVQGFVVLGAGILLLILLFIHQKFQDKKYFISALSVAVTLTFIAVLDIFQKVPWKPYLYSSTIETRGDYWRTGIAMGQNHPIFGVGLDKYLEWYRSSRDSVAAARPYANEVSNSAHNIFIDYFAWGGYPLLIMYSLLQLYIVVKLFKIVMNLKRYNSESLVVLMIFIVYFLQSLISPVHLGFAVWGWLASGLILGWKLEKNSEKIEINVKHKLKVNQSEVFVNQRTKTVSLFLLGITVGALISTPYIIQEIRFRNGVYGEKSYSQMYNAAYIWPKSSTRMAQASWKLYINGSTDKSLEVALDAVRYSPNNFYGWMVLYSRSDLDENLRKEVEKNINRLEPRANNIKKFG